MIQVPETPAEKVAAPITQVVPFLAGAGNSLLFDLPEAAIKGIGGDKVREIVDTYKKLNPGFGAGGAAGTVGSLIIPAGGIARTLGGAAKAVGASKLASGLDKVADVAAGPVGIKQGLTAGAEQAIPRAISEQVETGDLGETAAGLGTNVALGGALGGGLSLGKKVLGHLPKRLGEEAEELANDQFLSQVFGKTLGRSIRQVIGNKTGAASQIDRIDNLKNDMVSILDKNGIKSQQQVEDLLGENGKAWQEIGDGVNKAIRNKQMESLGDLPADMLAHPDVTEAVNLYGKAAEDAIQDIAGQVSRVATDPANTFVKTREILNKNIGLGMKGGTAETIRGDVASAMKNYFDQKAMEMVPDSQNIAKLKEIYPAFLAMGRAIARDKAAIAPAFTPGSDTYARFASSISTPSELPTAVASNVAGQVLNRAATGAANILGSEGALALKKLIPRNAEGVPLELSDIPQGVQNVLGATGKAAAGAIERAPQILPGEESDGDIGPLAIPAGGPIPELQPVDFEMPVNPLDQSLALAWQLEDPQGNIEAQSPGAKQAFIEGVKKNLTNRDGSINYLRAADALFPGKPDDAKQFREAYTTLQRVRLAMPNAVKLVTVGNSRAEADKQAVVDSVSEVLKKAQGMKEEDAIKRVKGILDSPFKTPAQKGELLFNLMRTADPYSFGEGGLLERAGVTQ